MNPPLQQADSRIPICVDLDGTFIRSDLLLEGVLRFLRHRPADAWRLIPWTLAGKTRLKSELARALPPPTAMPSNPSKASSPSMKSSARTIPSTSKAKPRPASSSNASAKKASTTPATPPPITPSGNTPARPSPSSTPAPDWRR